jgi:hypothetical protein
MLIASSWLDQSNSAEKKAYRHSLTFQVVYYRRSYRHYPTKISADNITVPITRSRHVE